MKKSYSECRYPWENVQIMADGVVKPCCWIDGAGVGNMNLNSFEEVWNGEKMQELREYIERGEVHQMCKGRPCPYNTVLQKS
jgi:radical SAM protein with 4Fe4S-binding SPASM domain